MPLVIFAFNSSTLALTALERFIMLASGSCEITTTAEGFPLTSPRLE